MSADVALKEGFRGRKLQRLEVLPSETASVRGSSFLFFILFFYFYVRVYVFLVFKAKKYPCEHERDLMR